MFWKKALSLLVLLAVGTAGSAIAQTGTISGTVTAASSGETLPGANVVIVGTQKGSSTDANGQFTIAGVTPGMYTVRASFVGYRVQTKEEIEVVPGETTVVDFALKAGVEMGEMVVVGYGTQQRSDLTGSISSVPTGDLEESPVESAQEAIQGKVAGVTVTQNTGSPGSGFSVRIRGTGTTGNSNPLYVVDGVPVSGATETGIGGIDFLNPSNIESIDILKGASAAAIYGAQAANGAVIITTKSGEKGSRQVSFNAYVGAQETPRTIDMLNGPEYAALRNEADINAGQSPTFASPSQYLGANGTSTNWQDHVFQQGIAQNYNVAVSGGSEDLTYRISGGYFEEEGIINKSSLRRLNVRVNTEFDVNSFMTVGQKATFKRSNRNTISESDNVRNLLIQTLQVDPTVSPRDSAGNYTAQPRTNAQNPLAVLDFTNNDNVDTRLVGNVYTDLSLLESLSFRSRFGFDLRYGNTYAFTPTYDISPSFRNNNASATQYSDIERSLVWDNTVTFDKTFDTHNVKLLGGTTIETNRYRFMNGTTQGQPGNAPSLRYLGAGTEVVNLDGALTESNLLSFFGRLNYNYDSRYLLTAVARYDGSSRFGSNNRFAFFPSFSAAWRVSEEPFFPETDLINNLKLRAGWGQNGNQRIGAYPFASTIADDQDYLLNGQLAPGSAPLQSPNPNVKWEETTQTDVGLDATLLNESLDLSVGFFNKRTSDLLVYLPPIPTSGLVQNSPENAGEIRNRGWEFSADYRTEPIEDFSFSVGANLTTLDNEVLSLANTDHVINSGFYRNGSITRTAPGHPVGAFYGYVTDGLFQTQDEVDQANARDNDPSTPYQTSGTSPGDIRFKDLNGDGQITEEDQTYIGNPHPDFTYGFNLNAAYKGISLSAFLQGSYGNDIFAAYKYYTVFNTAFNLEASVKDRWTGPGTSTKMPRLTTSDPNQNIRISDFYVQDGSYLRLQNIRLGYEVPSGLLGVISETGLSKAKVYVSAKNLVTITGYDGYTPEIGVNNSTLDRGIDRATYPQPRAYTVGIGLTF